jgi:hypothetical protein
VEQDLPSTEFLYDFIYIDTKRFSLYFAQLDPHGTLTGIKKTASENSVLNASGKVGAFVASGTVSGSSTVVEGVERQFDPLWTLPITVINRLDELKFIKRSAADARVGELFLAKGRLQILDVRTIKELFPLIADKTSEVVGGQSNVKVVDSLKHFPDTLQMYFFDSDSALWATLNPDNMIIGSDDFILKHGSAVPGEWHILGVLDAFEPISARLYWGDLRSSDMVRSVMKASEAIRKEFGRPNNTVAITPLAIFRAIRPTDGLSGESPQ